MHSLIALIPSAGLLMQHYGLLLDHLSHTPAPGDGFLIVGVSETAPRCVLAHVAKILFSGGAGREFGEVYCWRCSSGLNADVDFCTEE